MGSGRKVRRNIMRVGQPGKAILSMEGEGGLGDGVPCFIQEQFQPQDQGRVKLEARSKYKFSKYPPLNSILFREIKC